MSIPIALRTDFDAASLRRAAKATKDAAQGKIVPAYKSSCRYTLARASTFCTAEMCHRPPRAERIPRLFSA